MNSSDDAAKRVICLIIALSGGKLEGKVRLYKAFYYAHLYYWRDHKGVLTSHPIARMPAGPGIDRGDDLISQLQQEGRVLLGYQDTGPYRETVFELGKPVEVDPAEHGYEAIEKAVEWVRGRSAAELTAETHLYSRSWRDGTDGQVLDVYSDLLTDEEYAAVKDGVTRTTEMVNEVFG